MLTEIEFVATGCCTATGNYAPGDTARVADSLARHLVSEVRCAKYAERCDVAGPAIVDDRQAPVAPVKRGRGRPPKVRD